MEWWSILEVRCMKPRQTKSTTVHSTPRGVHSWEAASSPDADMGPVESASQEVRYGNLWSVLTFTQHCDTVFFLGPSVCQAWESSKIWSTTSPWDARQSVLEPWALTTHLAPRPGALDHGTSPPLCTCSTTAGEVSTAGSIHPYTLHVKTPIRRVTSHIYFWCMRKNLLWLWKSLYVEPF